MKVHYLQHVAFEDLGCIQLWLDNQLLKPTSTQFFNQSFKLPNIEDFDMLIILGGPMGVYDSNQYSWIDEEKKFIEKSIKSNKLVLGICLGAQLIASVLGSKVYQHQFKEIGWYPISKTKEGINSTLLSSMNKEMIVLHWHGDTFDLPQNALHLAFSHCCQQQAFSYNDERVLGLQFHFEATINSVEKMIENDRQELISDNFIQSETEINLFNTNIKNNNDQMYLIMEKFKSRFALN